MKRLSKKVAASALAASMVMGSLTGCGKQETPSAADTSKETVGETSASAAALTYPAETEELGSGEVKWSSETTADGWIKVTNNGGKTLGYSPDSGVALLQQDGFAFKDLNKNGKLDLYEDWRMSAEERAADLVTQLSVEEMAGMMIHPAHSNVSEDASDITEMIDAGLRFVLSGATAYAVDVQATWNNTMQAYSEAKEHGVPVNVSTNPRTTPTWPDNLGLAATFDPNVVYEAAKGMSKEYRSIGISTLLGPQIDLATDPRWCRVSGTFGEDPALSRDMTAASVAGHQSTFGEDGTDLGWGEDSVNAMIKHFPGDGAGEGGRESHDFYGKYTVYPGGQFYTHLIPFVDGGLESGSKTGSVAAVMPSYSIAYSEDEEYGELVGSGYSEWKLDLLHSYDFDGVICTDWNITLDPDQPRAKPWGVEEMTQAERCYAAITAGCDQLGALTDPEPILAAYQIGVEEEGEEAITARFRESARRLMKMSMQTGLFENPYVSVADAVKTVGGEEMSAAGYEAQLKSIVMLKNDDNTIKAADGTSGDKPTVYIPYVYTSKVVSQSKNLPAAAVLPVDLDVARQYVNVVTDRVSETLTGSPDKDGKATPAYEDIIRATKEELAECDYALVFVNSPNNVVGNTVSPGYDMDNENYIPISLQYRDYIAMSDSVRVESISGDMVPEEIWSPYGSQYIEVQENRSYYGKSAKLTNGRHLDSIFYAAENMPEDAKVIVAIDAANPMVVAEFEEQADAILMGFAMNKQTIFDIVTGQYEPSGLLPFQMPASMDTVEAQYEDVPRDMECYVDSKGNTYDFAFGLNYSGVIQDARTDKYAVPALTEPENQPNK